MNRLLWHITRTTLCVEVRDPPHASGPAAEGKGEQAGVLYVFMPPLPALEDYLALLAAVEATAAELGMTIVLEGYPPPRDPRLMVLQVTPDPGVNRSRRTPGSKLDRTRRPQRRSLHEAARLSRLSTEKFMLDGRHTGTGGGNHIVMGGATAGDSPFLRRPDLLGSLPLRTGTTIHPCRTCSRVCSHRADQPGAACR